MKTALGYSTGLAYAALSLTCLFNLVTIAPFASWLGTNLVAASSGTPGELALKGLSLACAAANLALLALMVRRQAASSPRPVAEAR